MPPASTSPVPAERAIVPLLAALAGGLMLGAMPRRGAARPVVAAAGVAMLGFAARWKAADQLSRVGARRRGSELRISMLVDLPIDRVFAFCSDFENFPRLVSTLRSVHDDGVGRSHWCAATPSGGTVEWDAVTTKYVHNAVIAWRSVPNAPVAATGLMRFVPEHGGTCVTLQTSYRIVESGVADSMIALILRPRAKTLEAEIRKLEQRVREASADAADEKPPA